MLSKYDNKPKAHFPFSLWKEWKTLKIGNKAEVTLKYKNLRKLA